MTDYSNIISGSALVLTRTPMDPSLSAYRFDGALLRMNRHGAVSLVERGYAGGDMTPLDERYHVSLVAHLGTAEDRARVIDLDRLRADLAEGGALSVLLDRMAAGHRVSGERGHLTEDAEEAFEELRALCEGGYVDVSLTPMGADDYLADGVPVDLPAGASDAEISASARAIVEDAQRSGIVLVGSVEDVLRERRC